MDRLTIHIQKLLFHHNYVIINDVGGFVSQYIESKYHLTENCFDPPFKTISFNPRLTMNDGLLVQSYMNTYDIDYYTANDYLKNDISSLKMGLLQNGSYYFSNIGTLYYTQTINSYRFIPCTNGIDSSKFYGLKCLYLHDQQKECKKIISCKQDVKATSKNDSYHFSINKYSVNYIIAFIIALVCYFSWSQPLSYSSSENNMASLIKAEELFHYTTSIKEKQIKHQKTIQQPISSNLTLLTSNQKIVHKVYTIVLASQVSQKGAELLVKQLKKNGFHEVTIHKPQDIRRVIYGKYDSSSEASKSLAKLRSNTFFNDAWIMVL